MLKFIGGSLSWSLEALQSLHLPRHYAHLATTRRFQASVVLRVGCNTKRLRMAYEKIPNESSLILEDTVYSLSSTHPILVNHGWSLCEAKLKDEWTKDEACVKPKWSQSEAELNLPWSEIEGWMNEGWSLCEAFVKRNWTVDERRMKPN